MSITRDFKLSLVAGRSVPLVINANQYDDGEIWRFTLLDENGQKYSPSTGSIIGLKSDGHIIANAGTVSSTGLVIIPETEQMTASPGKNIFELLIDDDTHGTANFIVLVEPRPGADGTPSDSDLAVFQEAIDAAAQIGDASELVDDVAVLKSRMDEFTTLTDGSTTGDAELADIRVGADGTTYPNAGDAVRGQVSDLKNALEESFEVYPSLRPTLIPGKYVNATDNSIDTSANFAMTVPIPVKKGQIVHLTATGYSTVTGMIALCNADNTSRTTVVPSIDDAEHTYTYEVAEDGYIVCSFKTSNNAVYKLWLQIDYYSQQIAIDLLNPIYQGINPVAIVVRSTGYIDATNNRYTAQNNFNLSESIRLYKNQTVKLTATGYRTVVGMINLYDADNDLYQTVVASIDDTERTYTYTATENCFVRFSYNKYHSANVVIETSENTLVRIDTIEETINDLSTETLIQYPQLFDNILCIGDSLTVGYDGSGDIPLVKNYPHFLEKLTDANTTLKAHGGWTAKQIWDGEISTATDLANYDCAIIFLGTNGGLTDTVSTDCKSDYTQNADTNTGCYGKIIGKIKTEAPNCKIFCVAGVNEYIRRATTMNPAVRALAEFYNVGMIDVENCIMSDSGSASSAERYLYRPVDGIHYNELGYMTLANMFYDSMSTFMSAHRLMYA